VKRCLHVFSAPDGGVPEHVMRLALGLLERGWESRVAGPESASIYASLQAERVAVTRLPFQPGYGHPLEDGRVLRKLIGLLRRERFDLVNTHGAKEGILGRLAALTTGTPAVATQHAWSFDPAFRRGPGRVFSQGMERLLAPRTRAYICVAESVRRRGLEFGLAPPCAFHTVHNAGTSCDGGQPPDPELERFAREGPLAGCVAALRPEKCVDVLLKAAPCVLEQVPEARIAVVGNGPARRELERQAKVLGLQKRLRFFDFTPPSSRQLRSLDVFVLPSRFEGFPIGVLEAMACGVPPVATDVGGTREAFRHGESGLLCPPGDPGSLAQAIISLLGDSELRTRMGHAARERYQRHFTLERMLDRTVAVFDRVSDGARPR
jgi:glycosyltransferase involved in cell wall biosynthesis